MAEAIAIAVDWVVDNWTWEAIGKWLITAAITTGAAYGLGRLLAKKPQAGALTAGSPLDLQIDGLAPRRVIYGEQEVGGVLRFRHTQGGTTGNDYLYLNLLWAGHECEAITAFKVDGEVVTFDIAGNAIGTLADVLRVTHHLGAPGQTADANFVAELGALYGAQYPGSGCCYSSIRLKAAQDKWPTGVPQFTAVVKGRKVYDWRDDDQDIADPSTWLWSDNPAMCTADYLRGVPMPNADGVLVRVYGVGAPDTSITLGKLLAAANACDESVPLANFGAEKRYTCNGCFDTTAAPPDILDALGGSMAGKIVQVGADFHLYAGVWTEPDFTVDESMLRGEPTASNPLPRQERINVVKGTYNNPATSGQPDDFMQIVSDAFIELDGGELAKDLSLNFTNSDSMAQRIAKIALLRSRQGIVTDWPCNLKAVPALTGENVNVTSAEIFGWDTKAFELQEFTLDLQSGQDGGLGFTTELVMQETDPSIFDWSTDEEQTRDPAPNTNLPDPRSPAAPTGLTLTSGNTTLLLQPDGTIIPRLELTWTQPTDAFILSGGVIEIQYKPHALPDWYDAAPVPGEQVIAFILDVKIGVAMDARIRSRNRLGGVSAYSTVTNHTVLGDTIAPGACTSPAVHPYPGYVEFDWTPPAATPDLDEYIVLRGAGTNVATASIIGKTPDVSWDDPTAVAGMTYYYFVKAVDSSGNIGTATAGVSTTAVYAPAGLVPLNPSATTRVAPGSNDTYQSGDGASFAFMIFAVPALPARAVWQNLLYRVNGGSTEWTVGAQMKNATAVNIRLDDLTPGVSYEVATQAWNGAGGSAVTAATSSPFTAPVNSGAPAAPMGAAFSTDGVIPKFIPATPLLLFGSRVLWDKVVDKAGLYTIVKSTFTDTDAATDYSYDDASGAQPSVTKENSVCHYSAFPWAGFTRVQHVNRSGVASAWTRIGNINSSLTLGTGTLSAQDSDNTQVTQIKMGSSAPAINVQAPPNTVLTIASGGSSEERVYMDISSYGFSYKPDACEGGFTTNSGNVAWRYDWDDTGNSSTQIAIIFQTMDGSNLTGGASYRLCPDLKQTS